MSDLYREVISLRHKLNDVLDDPVHPAAQVLKREVQALEDAMQVKNNSKSLEAKTVQVIRSLKQAEHAGVISQSDASYLHKCFEEIQRALRKL